MQRWYVEECYSQLNVIETLDGKQMPMLLPSHLGMQQDHQEYHKQVHFARSPSSLLTIGSQSHVDQCPKEDHNAQV